MMLSAVSRQLSRRAPAFPFRSVSTVPWDARVSGLDDGSESTLGQDGSYTGSWDARAQRPHGEGAMAWDNGITFSGSWRDGLFHGVGAKMYSRGGGYEGEWCDGKRQGDGCMIFAGKFGYDRWVGSFADDKPHGMGVMEFPDGTLADFEYVGGKPKLEDGGASKHDGPVTGLEDGSPSTAGVGGRYSGDWDAAAARPHGFGVMRWDNGIEYKGVWADGRYHGHGRKLYSRGGGYEGAWVHGRREGWGINFFGDDFLGKHGVLRWEGPFENDRAHGSGQAYVQAEMDDEHGRWSGDLAVKGPTLEFCEGQPVGFPSDDDA